jgi:hypothetical protein
VAYGMTGVCAFRTPLPRPKARQDSLRWVTLYGLPSHRDSHLGDLMAVIENSIWIDRSIEEVFDYASDLLNERKFNPDLESVEKLTNDPVGIGTTYLAKWKQSQQIKVECTHFDRPHEWVYVNGGPVAVTLTIRVISERSGTRMISSSTLIPRDGSPSSSPCS